MKNWLKEWGQLVATLVAISTAFGAFYGFLRSDMMAMEERFGTRITSLEERFDRIADRLDAGIAKNAESIAENAEGIAKNAEAIARLEGYIRGRLGDPPPEFGAEP